MKIFIVIPAYNEDKTLTKVLEEIKNEYSNIIVVDDGSTDNTYQQALLAKVTVLSHLINRGQGAALKTGIDYSLKQGADIIITFDADGQHQVTDIKDLIQPIINGEAEIVLGSRFLEIKNKIPFWRKVMLKTATVFTRFTSGLKLTDTHNGLRAISRPAAEKIKISQDRMAHSSEIINEIKRNNLKYAEVPVTINYTDYSLAKGQSAFDSVKILKDLVIKKLIK
jgi:glycosyltransferase involved in cell wall biosynthesis